MNNVLLFKLLSGRYILTVVTSACFLITVIYLLVILKEKATEVDANQIILLITNSALIIQNVFNSYFNKKRDETYNGSGSSSSAE